MVQLRVQTAAPSRTLPRLVAPMWRIPPDTRSRGSRRSSTSWRGATHAPDGGDRCVGRRAGLRSWLSGNVRRRAVGKRQRASHSLDRLAAPAPTLQRARALPRRRRPRPSPALALQRGDQRAGLNERRSAGVDQERCRPHPGEVRRRDDAPGRVDQTQVQREHVALRESTPPCWAPRCGRRSARACASRCSPTPRGSSRTPARNLRPRCRSCRSRRRRVSSRGACGRRRPATSPP
jgi:hypothetical protein